MWIFGAPCVGLHRGVTNGYPPYRSRVEGHRALELSSVVPWEC